MAKVDIKFIDCVNNGTYIKVNAFDTENNNPNIYNIISINGISDVGEEYCLWLDKSTAIKFAKTLRTEINKITESEVDNG